MVDVSRMVMGEDVARGGLGLASEKRLKEKDSSASVVLSFLRVWVSEKAPD